MIALCLLAVLLSTDDDRHGTECSIYFSGRGFLLNAF